MKIYYQYDRARIMSTQNFHILKKLFEPFPNITADKPEHLYQLKKGYCSQIEIYQPDETLLDFLCDNEKKLEDYAITYLEIAEDTICPDKQTAMGATDTFAQSLCKKWSSRKFECSIATMSPESYDKFLKRKKDSSMFGIVTYYLGNDSLMLRAYARNSKINNLTCSHREFAIGKGACNVSKKTGIRTVHDLRACNLEKIHKEIFNKYFTTNNAPINIFKFGMLLEGRNMKRDTDTFTDSERLEILYTAMNYQKYPVPVRDKKTKKISYKELQIITLDDLVRFFQYEKKRIEKTPFKKQTPYDFKVKKLTKNKIIKLFGMTAYNNNTSSKKTI